MDASNSAHRTILINKIEDTVANYNQVKQGLWRGGKSDYLFYRKGTDVVITKPDGEFVTILSDGVNNSYFKQASNVYGN